MDWNSDRLMGLDWEDLSPPNMMLLGDVVSGYEAFLSAKGFVFRDGYVGAEEIFEKMMMGDLDAAALTPHYQTLCELGAHEDMAKMSAEEFDELMSPIYAGLSEKKEEASSSEIETVISLNDNDEVTELVNFVHEAQEQLGHLENQFPELRAKKNDGTFLNTLFRRIHTIKGASGFFGLVNLTQISHELENVMDKARNGKLDIDDEVVSVLVRGAEWMARHLDEILSSVEEVSLPCQVKIDKGVSDPVHYGCLAVLSRPEAQVKMEKVSAVTEESQDSTIHISQNYLDDFIQDVGGLLNLAHIFKHSESVLASSQLGREEVQRFKENFFALEEKTDSLQKRLMTLRRVKVKQLLDKVPKIVFRLMQVVAKKVEVKIEGEDIEIDRSMLSVLEDPFVHILRNSMDHGIETPEERLACGKPEVGVFKISVTSAQNFVHIAIADDGKGINGEVVSEIAIGKGVVSRTEVSQMTLSEKQELIFHPGFSTREQATEISGRGVGMDVVRSKIVEAGGYVSLSSTLGKGTLLTLSLPIAATLSTRSLLRVQVSGQWVGIPMEKVDSISCLTGKGASLSRSGSLELFPYRGKSIPVITLGALFGSEKTKKTKSEDRSFIVIRELKEGVAFEVDDFSEFETHVIQDFLEGHFEGVPFDGASVMGDGSICLMLSIDKVLAKTKLIKTDQIGGRSLDIDSADKISARSKEHCVLIIQPSEESLLLSIEMSWVSRIETFSPQSLKRLKGKRIYQCNMGLLQYYECSEFGLGKAEDMEGISTVVILELKTRVIALGIHRIEDMFTGAIEWLGTLSLPLVKNSWSYQDRLVASLDMNQLSSTFTPVSNRILAEVSR